MKKAHQLLIAGLSIALAAGAAVSVNWYKMDQQEKTQQNQLVLDKGIALYNQGKYPEALQTLEAIAPGAIQDWHLPYYKGAASVRLKDYQTAATYLEQAKNLNSSEAQILYLLGVVYYKLGNLKLSEGYFAATLELNPNHEQARGLMGVMSDLQKLQEQPADQAQNPAPTENP
jgi:Flp pilus assembly protein TadD